MEKKLFVSIVAIFLLITGILSIFHVGNTWELEGEFSVYEEPKFSISNYTSGQYQNDMENYFSNNYTGHNLNIRTYNQIRYSLFHTSSSVVVGAEGYLYETPYIAESLGIQENVYLSEETIQQLAEQIYRIQTEAIQQGKAFVFVFTPSKADFEREYIPERYYEMETYYGEDERNYHRLMKAFDQLGVVYIDGTMCLKEKATDIPIFYKTGTHWSRMAALTVMNEITYKLNTEYDMHIKSIEFDRLEELKVPKDEQDQDLYRLLNVFVAKKDPVYYWPEETTIMSEGYELPKIFIQGGSYTNKLADISSEHQLFSELWREFYARSLYDYNRKIGYSTSDLNCNELKQAVYQADIILLESNVENINNLMPNMYDTIYQYMQEEGELSPVPLIRSGVYGLENDGTPFAWATKDILYEISLDKGQEEIQLQLELPLDILHLIYGGDLTESLVVYVDGREIGQFGYDSSVLNIQLNIEELDLSEETESVVLEIIAPYSFQPSHDLGGEDTRELAYKIRKIGGEEIGF